MANNLWEDLQERFSKEDYFKISYNKRYIMWNGEKEVWRSFIHI